MRIFRRIALAFVLLLIAIAAPAAEQPKPAPGKTRIACAGDSISGQTGWPERLQKMLGDQYEVKAFALNGTSVLRSNIRSVWRRAEVGHALVYQPNIVIMMYDHAAAKPENWNQKAFLADYKALVARFQKLQSQPKIYLCLPVPASEDCYHGVNPELLNTHVVAAVRQIAEDLKLPLIDTHAPLKGKADMICLDGIFPTERGYATVAAVVYTALTGKPAPPQPETSKPAPEEKPPTPPDQPLPGWKDKGDVPAVVELKIENILDLKGDGPDGKPNTGDDTWGFWFELASSRNIYHRLDLHTSTLSAEQRVKGIVDPTSRPGHQAKVAGPIASSLPNAADTEGWIFHSDWDGRFEGVWADKKAGCVMVNPYVEKSSHRSVAITYRLPATGVYTISGKVADMQVSPTFWRHDGVTWKVEVTDGGNKGVLLEKGLVGDGHGRPDSEEFKVEKAKLGGGRLVRLVINPNQWWGTDLTRIDCLKIEKVENEKGP